MCLPFYLVLMFILIIGGRYLTHFIKISIHINTVLPVVIKTKQFDGNAQLGVSSCIFQT